MLPPTEAPPDAATTPHDEPMEHEVGILVGGTAGKMIGGNGCGGPPDIFFKSVYLDHSPADLDAFRTVL